MRIVVSSDWQCSLTNMDRCRKHVDQVVDILKTRRKDNHTTFFVHGGDLKESFNPMDIRVQNFIIESLTRIRQNCTGAYFVRGNHDLIAAQDNVPSCVPLVRSLDFVTADDDYVKIPIRLLTWNSRVVKYCLLYLVPYFRDPVRQKLLFRNAAKDASARTYQDLTCQAVGTDNIKLLFFHNEIAGCKQSAHTTGAGLTADDIGAANYDLCIGGHIHVPQFIPPNIHYIGSPFPMTWGEANQDHRILTIEIDEARR